MLLGGVEAAAESEFEQRFFKAMDDDFNTPEALTVLFDLVRELNCVRAEDEQKALPLAALLVKLAGILGILQNDAEAFLKSGCDLEKAGLKR